MVPREVMCGTKSMLTPNFRKEMDTWLAPPRYRASNETVLLVTVGGLAILTLLMVLFYAIFK